MRGEAHRKRRLEKAGLALLSAILLVVSFQFLSTGWVGFVALVPLLLLFVHPRYDAPWYWILPTALVFEAWKYHRTVIDYIWFAPLALALAFLPQYLFFPLAVRFVRRRAAVPLVLLAPLAWTTVEWLRIHTNLGNMAHTAVGTNLCYNGLWIQIADLFGIYGLSFLTVAVNGAVADALLCRGRVRGPLGGLLAPRAVASLAAAGILVAATLGYGALRLKQRVFREGPRVAILQPDEPHFPDPERAYATHQRQFQMTKRRVEPGAADLVAWPENAIMDVVNRPGSYYLGELRELAAELDADFLVGGFGWDEEGQNATNGVWLVRRGGDVAGRYDKQVLAPWTEYLPLRWLVRPIPPLDRGYRAFVRVALGNVPPGIRGGESKVFTTTAEGRTYRFGIMTCGENVVPRVAREAVLAGAEFLFNPTSEGNLGRHAYYNTWANCTLRAVENRVGVVRVGNNGISGFIGPDGRPYGEVRGPGGRLWLTRGVSIQRPRIDDARSPTFFTRRGAWVGAFFPVVTLLLAALVALPRRAGERGGG